MLMEDFPYYFDEAAAKLDRDFYKFCRHSKGEWAGQIIEPEPWQQFIDWNIFGWKKLDGSRRFRVVYECMGRKNGKTTKLAAKGNKFVGFDGEEGAEIYTTATKMDQAKKLHQEAVRMVKRSPALSKHLSVRINSIFSLETNSMFVPLGQDSKTEDGANVYVAFVDEYHAHPDSGMYDVMRSGMGSRRQPLLWVITTAGFEKDCACYREQEYAENVLRGIVKDESYFAIIYTLDDPETEWMDKTKWKKANPNLGVSIYWDDIIDEFNKAVNSPTNQNAFKTKRLNIWTQATALWITDKSWMLCQEPVDADALKGRSCYPAFDLSTSQDFTAWVLCFPPESENEPYRFLFRFFLPQEDLEENVPDKHLLSQIRHWIKEGYISTTPGNFIDYEFVETQILKDAEIYDFQKIAYDPHNASSIVTKLTNEGFELIPLNQGYAAMSPASKDFENKVLAGKIAHGNNPVMKWMISCTEVSQGPSGDIKPVKPERHKSSKRIDGVVAAIMALDSAVRNTPERSAYDDFHEVVAI